LVHGFFDHVGISHLPLKGILQELTRSQQNA
jgi:hypothetical protein